MRCALGIDIETTGLDREHDEIIEVGAVLWDIDAKAIVDMFGKLILSDAEIKPDITDITGIHPHMRVEPHAVPMKAVLSRLRAMAEFADYYVAHNIEFEVAFLQRAVTKERSAWHDLPWIDTMSDIEYPKKIKTRALNYLAVEHGIFNLMAHRGVFDAVVSLKVLSLYDFDQVAQAALLPLEEIIAQVSYDEKDKAKAEGFYWDGERRLWHKTMRQGSYDPKAWDFKIRVNPVTRPRVLAK